MKKYFLIYNDGTHNFFNNQLINSVKTHAPEFEVLLFNKKDIDNEFIKQNKRILDFPRGGGYWLWKPYIINETLKKLEDGDVLFYLDSKYYFIEEFSRLYREPLSRKDIIVWKNKPNEPNWFMKNWCKQSVIEKYGMKQRVFQDQVLDCWAGCVVMKKTDFAVNFMKEWLNMCCVYEDITDSPSSIPNSNDFRDHRHDQSLLSILLYKYGIDMETFEKKYLQNVRRPF
jgi:hypothetical protein